MDTQMLIKEICGTVSFRGAEQSYKWCKKILATPGYLTSTKGRTGEHFLYLDSVPSTIFAPSSAKLALDADRKLPLPVPGIKSTPNFFRRSSSATRYSENGSEKIVVLDLVVSFTQ